MRKLRTRIKEKRFKRTKSFYWTICVIKHAFIIYFIYFHKVYIICISVGTEVCVCVGGGGGGAMILKGPTYPLPPPQ